MSSEPDHNTKSAQKSAQESAEQSANSRANDQHDAAYQQVTRSGRRLTRLREWLYRMALPLALGLLRMLWASYRCKKVVGAEHLERALVESEVVIPTLWHQHLMLGVRYLLDQHARGLKLGFLVSPSVDGEAGAMAAKQLGGYVIRGSATYTGARALRDLYIAVAKEKLSLLVTPDGPRGPRYEFKPGALLISQLANKPIVPIAFAASPVFKFRAWDRFILPLPFARYVIAVGEPIQVPRVMGSIEMQQMQVATAEKLGQLYALAHRELLS